VACILFIILSSILYSRDSESAHLADWWNPEPESARGRIASSTEDPHPIVNLIQSANKDFEELRQKETLDLPSAAKRYRQKRGRHPPPGFERWWQYAAENEVVMVEEFWDQIYHDLNPLWALDPKEMLKDVHSYDNLIMVRNGSADFIGGHFWMPIWTQLVDDIAEHLPDMDLAMNIMDEPRLLVPWENMKSYVDKERKERRVPPISEVTDSFSGKLHICD
jgi:hypothetical protein